MNPSSPELLSLRTTDGQVLGVRRLRSGDDAALQAFNAGLGPESRRKFLPHGYDDATVATVLQRAEAVDDATFGAFAGDRLVAYFFLWRIRERVPLLGIGITDEFQHRGLGRQILVFLIAEARTRDRDGIELTTMLDNHNAFALYQKTGFVYHGDVENVVGDGRVVIERAMFYAIRPGAQPPQGRHAPPV
ncbi:GNAT family N-acetyltransferase [bacterium]|nr:GNAT family N-acetyltransferase [bacterium]